MLGVLALVGPLAATTLHGGVVADAPSLAGLAYVHQRLATPLPGVAVVGLAACLAIAAGRAWRRPALAATVLGAWFLLLNTGWYRTVVREQARELGAYTMLARPRGASTARRSRYGRA